MRKPPTMMEAIRAAKSKKIEQRMRGSENLAKRAVALGEDAKLSRSSDPAVLASFLLQSTYYDMLAAYNGKNNFLTPIASKKSVAFWKRVDALREGSGVSPVEFIQAQFDWFDRTFHCAPTLPSLCTEKAVQRAQEFKGIAKAPVRKVEYKSEQAEILRYYDEQIRTICKAQKMTKEEFYRNLVMAGHFPVPAVYLNLCPVWKALKNG